MILHQTKAIDTTRFVLETSGWTRGLTGPEIRDDHDYTSEPERMRQRWIDFFKDNSTLVMPARYGSSNGMKKDFGTPFLVSEFGGAGFDFTLSNSVAWGPTPKTKAEFMERYEGLINALLDNPNLAGFCYTQLTDVEQEQNGLYYYDRRPKFDIARIRAITARRAAYEITGPQAPPPPLTRERDYQVLVGAAADGELSKPYRFTTQNPGANWTSETFADDDWQSAPAPFGTTDKVRTRWDSSDIWLRRKFDWNGEPMKSGALVIEYDEDTEVFVNGQKIWSHSGFINNYNVYDVTATLQAALKKGEDTLAVHTRQTAGGQFIDLALLVEP